MLFVNAYTSNYVAVLQIYLLTYVMTHENIYLLYLNAYRNFFSIYRACYTGNFIRYDIPWCSIEILKHICIGITRYLLQAHTSEIEVFEQSFTDFPLDTRNFTYYIKDVWYMYNKFNVSKPIWYILKHVKTNTNYLCT